MKLEFLTLSRRFGEHSVIDQLDHAFAFPHVLSFIGPSGGGKSTLLRLIAGLIPPTEGSILVDSTPLPVTETALRDYRMTLGVVFQSSNLFPHLTALENVLLPLTHVHGIAPKEALFRGESILSRLGLASHQSKRPGALSGGQRQRVAIARALAIQPKLLLFDEPTSSLDPEMTAEVLEVILELRSSDTPLLLVTHELSFARQVSDQIAFLAHGKILESGDAASFFTEPQTLEGKRFLEKVLRY